MKSNLFPDIDNTPTHGKAQVIVGWKGLNIGIEYQVGNIRHGKPMQVSYGHIQNFVGADKDALDVYLGTKLASNRIFQVNQLKPNGDFDEHKFMLWFDDVDEAKSAYLAQMPHQFFGGISEVSLAQLQKHKK